MAQLTEARKSIEQPFMNIFWQYRKKYGDPEESEEYWHNLVEETNAIYAQFGRDPYVGALLLCVVDDVENQARIKYGSDFSYKDYDLLLGVVNRLRRNHGKPPVKVVDG